MFNDLIGKKHHEVGRCAGLAKIVCHRLGIELPDWNDICVSQAESEIESRKGLFDHVTTHQPGDLVHVRTFENKHHVAVVIDNQHMLQSTTKHGVHRIRFDHPWVSGRIIGVYRYVG